MRNMKGRSMITSEIASLAEEIQQLNDSDPDNNIINMDQKLARLALRLSNLILEEAKQPWLPGIK